MDEHSLFELATGEKLTEQSPFFGFNELVFFLEETNLERDDNG